MLRPGGRVAGYMTQIREQIGRYGVWHSSRTVTWRAPASGIDTSAVQGIAVTGTADGNGHWQYSLDGTTWIDFGSVSSSTRSFTAGTIVEDIGDHQRAAAIVEDADAGAEQWMAIGDKVIGDPVLATFAAFGSL